MEHGPNVGGLGGEAPQQMGFGAKPQHLKKMKWTGETRAEEWGPFTAKARGLWAKKGAIYHSWEGKKYTSFMRVNQSKSWN